YLEYGHGVVALSNDPLKNVGKCWFYFAVTE
ncbi:hypothetical protein C7439_1722, partial [Lachnoanaerobaculum umeaense]